MAQPPLTRQIQVLEQELGVQLLTRTRRRVQLTPAGSVFLQDARALLSRADAAVRAVRQAARGELGTLAVGFVGSATYDLLPEVLTEFRRAYPGVELTLHEINSSAQAAALLEGNIQIGFVRSAPQHPLLVSEVVQREPILLALPSAHRLASESFVRVVDLAEEAFVVFPRPSFTDQIYTLCAMAGFAPRVVQIVLEIQTAISIVSTGMAVTLVPASVARLQRPGVIYKELPHPAPTTSLVAAYRAEETSPVLHRFLSVVREVASHIQMTESTASTPDAPPHPLE